MRDVINICHLIGKLTKFYQKLSLKALINQFGLKIVSRNVLPLKAKVSGERKLRVVQSEHQINSSADTLKKSAKALA